MRVELLQAAPAAARRANNAGYSMEWLEIPENNKTHGRRGGASQIQ
jgi:hypothetical protein